MYLPFHTFLSVNFRDGKMTNFHICLNYHFDRRDEWHVLIHRAINSAKSLTPPLISGTNFHVQFHHFLYLRKSENIWHHN